MKIISTFGTRPEAIKMAPVVAILGQEEGINHRICITGQHIEMLNSVLNIFGIKPDINLGAMKPNQSLNSLFAKMVEAFDHLLDIEDPDIVLVHGDTTSAAACALAAFHRKIHVAHVEAGLRSGDLQQPFPEELNRRMIDKVSHWHFAPTALAKSNLKAEGYLDRVWVTGNTVIDSLMLLDKKLASKIELSDQLQSKFAFLGLKNRLVLVTGHRRENIGNGFEQICKALIEISRLPNIQIIYPLHLNPAVRDTVITYLIGHQNIHVVDPVNYYEFVWLMKRSSLILTDSGGVQEEAVFLGKPVLVMRNVTERIEALTSGLLQLVGIDPLAIVTKASHILNMDSDLFRPSNLYGDGRASNRVVDALLGRSVSEFTI